MKRLRTGIHATILAVAAACLDSTAPTHVDEGIVRNPIGCTTILTATRSLQPLTLPAEFRVSDLRVRIKYRDKPTNNPCMAGDVIEILSISRVP